MTWRTCGRTTRARSRCGGKPSTRTRPRWNGCTTRVSSGSGGCTSQAPRPASAAARCSSSRCCSRRPTAGACLRPAPICIAARTEPDMEQCDVLVVGGGPAGSTCAWQLARLGYDVIVLDRREFPRDKVCAGWITPQVVEELELDLADYARTRTLQPLAGFSCGLVGGRQATVDYGKTVSYAIRRCEFDDYLLRRAGARLRLGEQLESLERIAAGWRANVSIEARLVVGAGGHVCPVARHFGARVGRGEAAAYAQEAEFVMSPEQAAGCRVRPQIAELYFCRELDGYGWAVRKGAVLNVGLGRTEPRQLAEAVESFWHWLGAQGRIAQTAPPSFRGHAYLLHEQSVRPLATDAGLLVGDAAGLAYTASGEGIRPAVESALLAAATIHAARGDYPAVALSGYCDQVMARFGGHRGSVATAPKPHSALRAWLTRAALQNPTIVRHVVLDRRFLHRHEPALRVPL